jgi:hypothetical protein
MTWNRSPEQECPSCFLTYTLGAETTLFIYASGHQFDHFTTKCPGCRLATSIWELSAQDLAYLKTHNVWVESAVKIVEKTFATGDVEQAFHHHTGRPLSGATVTSSRRQRHIEERVSFFAAVLASTADPLDIM